MKFRTITKTITAEHTRHGRTVRVPEKHSVQVPKAPLNLDLLIRRALFACAVLATLGAIIWGTAAIGSMLAMIAPTWAAYLVAGVFDVTWAGALAAEWLLRYDDKRARVPRAAGMAALSVSMGALIAHGALTGSVVVGIIGALVSAASKTLWATALYTVRVKLDPVDAAYLELMRREAGTQLALALSERDRTVSEAKATQLRLSLEPVSAQPITADHDREHDSRDREHDSRDRELIASNAVTSANTDRDQPSIADLARDHVAITKDNKIAVAAILATVPTANAGSVAAAVRRARKKLEEGTGQYL